MTDIGTFRQSLHEPAPPADAGPALQALWWAAKGDWRRAHGIVQQHEGDADCDHVHAHLHRQEGDQDNARMWYRASGAAFPEIPLDQEWDALAGEMLSRPR